MKKIIKLLSISTLTSITSLQVIACSDNSNYKTFLSDIDNSKNNNTAFFGFLGSADDDSSNGLHDAFTYWQNGGINSDFQKWKNQDDTKAAMKKMNLTDIELKEYQGPPHQSKESVSQFWNDKNISWQRNIFKWILNNDPSWSGSTSDNQNFKDPITISYSGQNYATSLITTDKDSNKNIMFHTLPIVFCIVKGQLYTAGESWLPKPDPSKGPTPQEEIDDLTSFITNNILKRG